MAITKLVAAVDTILCGKFFFKPELPERGKIRDAFGIHATALAAAPAGGARLINILLKATLPLPPCPAEIRLL